MKALPARLRLTLAGLALVACGLAMSRCAHATRLAHPAEPGAPVLRVMTYNVNFGMGGDEETLAAIAAADADLVFLQETTPQWELAVRKELSATWPHQLWLDRPAAGGMAVLSKRPLLSHEVLRNPVGWFPAMRVIAETPLGAVQVLSVHLHPPVDDEGSWVRGYLGGTTELRKAEMEAFAGALDAGLPTLVVGDFNETPKGEAVQLLERRGLRTALPEFAPGEKTWHWPVGPLMLSAMLDHVVYDRSLEPLTARVDHRGRSDHFPVVAELVRATERSAWPPPPSTSSISVGAR